MLNTSLATAVALTLMNDEFPPAGRSSTEHPEIRTVHGNLLLLISGHNEFRTA
jgi:hypothetical protein